MACKRGKRAVAIITNALEGPEARKRAFDHLRKHGCQGYAKFMRSQAREEEE